ncbi:MATE family efflux transporter [Pseudodesulfovibrio sp.]|uniref:MATE family efflux transporter n=1 Tax=Pseudodesulfovibrio sp. TaxID=2035812 RepID=UPI00261EDC90|nr:MATE family efflux transporter [Pseudodesulfovibrio sp.]MDD3311180.1 MATE family efflux transporter [Pseudodesulfovibrio sp.]
MKIQRWAAKNGYRESLVIGFPLVVSMLSSTVMTFTDRIFLGHYSLESLAASFPANVSAFLFLSFFFGVVEYVGVFVSQYTGAARHERVGAAMWQGLWFCLPAGLFLAALWFLAGPLFDLAGHPPAVREQEVAYFRILTVGGGPFLVGACLSSFFSGRGLTKPVMVVQLAATALNIPLDYCMINGYGPFPEMGIVGAGIATLIGYVLPGVCYSLLIFTRENEAVFRVRSAWRFDPELFRRFLRFGLPGGIQFFVDMFAVTFFVFMVGRIGAAELAATNAAISIETLAFLPMIGMHIAVSIMVGQAMGAGQPDRAAYATGSVLRIALLYMGSMAILFICFPEWLMELFRARGDAGAEFGRVLSLGVVLMRYIAAFTLLDAVAITYMGGLKGAGDTRFIMLTMAVGSMGCVVIPLTLLTRLGVTSLHAPWACLLSYVIFLAVSFMVRFRRGPWRSIRLIEE